MQADDRDLGFVKRAVELALEARAQGNLPIGCVITLDGEVVAEGRNSLVLPVYNPGLHAEIVALRGVPVELWPRAREMTAYTTLEPCVMCMGTLLLHGVGRVVFGALDKAGGSSETLLHLPSYYSSSKTPEWIGPVLPELCDPLYEQVAEMFSELPCG